MRHEVGPTSLKSTPKNPTIPMFVYILAGPCRLGSVRDASLFLFMLHGLFIEKLRYRVLQNTDLFFSHGGMLISIW